MKSLFVLLLSAFIFVGTSVGVKATDVTAEKPDYELVDNQISDFDYAVEVAFQNAVEDCTSSFNSEQPILILKISESPKNFISEEVWHNKLRIKHYLSINNERLYLDERKSKFLDKYRSPDIFNYLIPISKQV